MKPTRVSVWRPEECIAASAKQAIRRGTWRAPCAPNDPSGQSAPRSNLAGSRFSIAHLSSAAARYTPWANLLYGAVTNSAITQARCNDSSSASAGVCLASASTRPLLAVANSSAMKPRSTVRSTAAGTPVIPGAQVVPVEELEARAREIARLGRPLLVYCAMGARSAAACEFLSHQGHEGLLNLADGFQGWTGPRAQV